MNLACLSNPVTLTNQFTSIMKATAQFSCTAHGYILFKKWTRNTFGSKILLCCLFINMVISALHFSITRWIQVTKVPPYISHFVTRQSSVDTDTTEEVLERCLSVSTHALMSSLVLQFCSEIMSSYQWKTWVGIVGNNTDNFVFWYISIAAF